MLLGNLQHRLEPGDVAIRACGEVRAQRVELQPHPRGHLGRIGRRLTDEPSDEHVIDLVLDQSVRELRAIREATHAVEGAVHPQLGSQSTQGSIDRALARSRMSAGAVGP